MCHSGLFIKMLKIKGLGEIGELAKSGFQPIRKHAA
jgi:hypothetical protein